MKRISSLMLAGAIALMFAFTACTGGRERAALVGPTITVIHVSTELWYMVVGGVQGKSAKIAEINNAIISTSN